MKNDNIIHKNNTWVLNNNKQNNGVTKKKSRIEYLTLLGKEAYFNNENNSQEDKGKEAIDMFIYTSHGVEKVSINTASNDKKNETNKSNRYQYLKEKINNVVKYQEKLKSDQIEEQDNSVNHKENDVNNIFVFDRNKNEINIISANDTSKKNNQNEIDDSTPIILDNCKNISEICTSQKVSFLSCDNKNEENRHSNKSKVNIFYDIFSEKNNNIDKRIEEVFQSKEIISKTYTKHKNEFKTNNIYVNNQTYIESIDKSEFSQENNGMYKKYKNQQNSKLLINLIQNPYEDVHVNKEPIEQVSINSKENNTMKMGNDNESFENNSSNYCNNRDIYYDTTSKNKQSHNYENNFNVHKEMNSINNKMENLNKIIEEINNKKHMKTNILSNKISSLDVQMCENQTNNINNELNILNSKIYNLFNEKINKIYEQITKNVHNLNKQINKITINGEYNELIKSFNSKTRNQTNNIKMQIRHLEDQVDNYLLMQKSDNLFIKINDYINNLNNQIGSFILNNQFLHHNENINNNYNDNNNGTKEIINVDVHNYKEIQNTDISSKKNSFIHKCNDIKYDHKKKRKVNENNQIYDDDNNGKRSLSIQKCINEYNHIENNNNNSTYKKDTIQSAQSVYSDKNENNDYNKLYNDEKFLYLKNKLIELKTSKMKQKLLNIKNSVNKQENMNIVENKDALDYINNVNKNECITQLRNNKQFSYINTDHNLKPFDSQNEGNNNKINNHKSSNTSDSNKIEEGDIKCGVQSSQNISTQVPYEKCHNCHKYNKKHKDIQNHNIYNYVSNNEKKPHDIISMFKKILHKSGKHKTHGICTNEKLIEENEINMNTPDEIPELNNLFFLKTKTNNLNNLQQNYNFPANKNSDRNIIPPQLNTSNNFEKNIQNGYIEKNCDSTRNWGLGHVIPTVSTPSNNNNGNSEIFNLSSSYPKHTMAPNTFTMDQIYKYTDNYHNDANRQYKRNDEQIVLEETNKENHENRDLNLNKETIKNNLKQKYNILKHEKTIHNNSCPPWNANY
ncbi:hypothetical protein Py17XNL_001002389 [Plasmodium yoelii yoelii]|uniref:ERYTHROCYTE MEMBRANE PROTEIN PFEMP3 n=1 Tax=Plasmodium yoelii yoelii TaxID=73239 RepID=A0AAF0B6C5_PLAYO|nr:hypothetical protein Py17XNL_001002389 [Plasmodium yoelii yoelii]